MSSVYREQLVSLVRNLAFPNLEPELPAPSGPEHVKLFVDGNLDKRLDKLARQLAFVAEQFDDFEAVIADYTRAVPLAALDNGTHDGDRMLAWLLCERELTDERRDYVLCQRARQAIQSLAARKRLAYLRFQERLRLVEEFIPQVSQDSSLPIHLNPIRQWARFSTSALLEDAATPANILFFAARGEVATALLELEGQTLINELADLQPCTLETWSALTHLVDPAQLAEFCRDLAGIGLVCFG